MEGQPTFDLDGLNLYLSNHGLKSINGIEIVPNGDTHFAPDRRIVVISGSATDDLVNAIKFFRENTDYKLNALTYGGFNITLRTLPYIIKGALQILSDRPVFEEIASNIENENPLICAQAAFLAHEIGHGQETERFHKTNRILRIAPLIIGLGLNITALIQFPENATALAQSAIGISMLSPLNHLAGRVVSEFLADNFAQQHAPELIPFIQIDSQQS